MFGWVVQGERVWYWLAGGVLFVVSAVFAALAGALTAHYAGFITPVKSSFMHSVELVIMVVFGGMASVFGAVVGAAVLTILPQFLTVLKDVGGVRAIEDLTLQVQRGAVHSIIGPNGGGKTSLINMLSGVYRPDAG